MELKPNKQNQNIMCSKCSSSPHLDTVGDELGAQTAQEEALNALLGHNVLHRNTIKGGQSDTAGVFII